MTDLEKYQKVNACETIESLEEAILSFADADGQIKGRSRTFDAVKMAEGARLYYDSAIVIPNVVTREFGLRQQLIYLKIYKGNKKI